MPNLPRFNDLNYIHFITTRTNNNINYFKDGNNCLLLLKNINHYRKKYQFKLLGYCVMPDHLHLLIIELLKEFSSGGVKPPASRGVKTNG